MARRMKSFTTASNKGKGGQVLLNNMCVIASKNRKKYGKEKATKARALARQQNAYSREMEAQRNRSRRRAEKQRREEQKYKEQVEKYNKRLELEFEKLGMILTTDLAWEITQKAIDASVSITQVKKYFIDGEEDELKSSAISEILVSMISEILIVSSVSYYLQSDELNPILFSHLFDKNYSSVGELAEDDELKKFLLAIIKRENHLESRIEENKEISKFISKLIDDSVMLPEDFSTLALVIDADGGMTLTVEVIKNLQEYNDGVKNKISLVKKVNTQYEKLIEKVA